jgi:hypothetical protein
MDAIGSLRRWPGRAGAESDPAIQKADLRPNAIGNDPCFADHVSYVGNNGRTLAPLASEVDLLRDLDRVIDLDAEIAILECPSKGSTVPGIGGRKLLRSFGTAGGALITKAGGVSLSARATLPER